MASSDPTTTRSHGSDNEEDEDELLANFLESEILSETPSQHLPESQVEEQKRKRPRVDESEEEEKGERKRSKRYKGASYPGSFANIPGEIFHHILKFLSSEDLISCSLVCKFMCLAASDESLWRHLYCMRWGLDSPSGKLHTCPWKKLYIQQDRDDMVEFIKNTPSEFKEYYIQMQAAKRSQAPLLSQVNDDRIILDKTVADKVSIWKKKRGLTDEVVSGHVCSGDTCTYSRIGDVFLCEKTGRVHVCDDTCREAGMDATDENFVCTISGRCFDQICYGMEEESDNEQQAGVADEAEPFMGSGRFARAYQLGYNCADEKELEATLRFC